jgi:hypothetical protein
MSDLVIDDRGFTITFMAEFLRTEGRCVVGRVGGE